MRAKRPGANGNRGETTRGETTRGEREWGRNDSGGEQDSGRNDPVPPIQTENFFGILISTRFARWRWH